MTADDGGGGGGGGGGGTSDGGSDGFSFASFSWLDWMEGSCSISFSLSLSSLTRYKINY